MTSAQRVKAEFDRDAAKMKWLKVADGVGTLDDATKTITFKYGDGSAAVLDINSQTFNVVS